MLGCPYPAHPRKMGPLQIKMRLLLVKHYRNRLANGCPLVRSQGQCSMEHEQECTKALIGHFGQRRDRRFKNLMLTWAEKLSIFMDTLAWHSATPT